VQDEKRRELEEEHMVNMTLMRKRAVGNIRFIGELFVRKLMPESSIHEYLMRLLVSPTGEQQLECFAKLMSTTGWFLRRPEAEVGVVYGCQLRRELLQLF